MKHIKQTGLSRASTLLASGGWWSSPRAARIDFYVLQLMGWAALALLGYFSAEYGALGGLALLLGLGLGDGPLLFAAFIALGHALIVVLIAFVLLLALFKPRIGHIRRALLVASTLFVTRIAASAFVSGDAAANAGFEIGIWGVAVLLPMGLLLLACPLLLRRFGWILEIASKTGPFRRIVPLFVLGIPMIAPAILASMYVFYGERDDPELLVPVVLLAEAFLVLLALLMLAARGTHLYKQGRAPF